MPRPKPRSPSPLRPSRSLMVAASVGGALGIGCGEPAAPGDDEALLESAAELQSAGSGVLELQPWNGGAFQAVSSTVDEFTRTGESLKLRIPVWYLWEQLNPGTALPPDATLRTLKVTAKVTFFDGTQPRTTRTVSLTRFLGNDYGMTVESASFTVLSRTDSLGFTLDVSDRAGRRATVGAAPAYLAGPPVFGGDKPNKTLYFDNDYGALRDRVIEFGHVIGGSSLTLGFSDWRADQLVNRSQLDTQIGKARFYGRFGPTIGPIYGKVVYEVLVGRKFDDGAGWQAEAPLAANTASRLLPPGRTAYELQLPVPQATELQLYFHVRAYLEVSYQGYEVVEAWYGDGQRLLKAETWDNPAGPMTNYKVPVD